VTGERIAVIGAGPAGLPYASLVAAHNAVTVFERAREAGGAFRLAGKQPLFQEGEPDERAFATYSDELVRACFQQNVPVRFGVVARHDLELLGLYARMVIATGARYRVGLGPLVKLLLDTGLARHPPLRELFARPTMRDWFYFQARRGAYEDLRRLARPGQM